MNSNLEFRNIIRLTFICVLPVLFVGCATVEPARTPIENYAKATTATTVVVSEYLSSINQFERDSEYRLLVWTPDKPMDIDKLRSSPFSETAVSVRLQVIGSLGKYGELLLTLIDSDFAGSIDSAIDGFKTSLSDSIKTINSITDKGKEPKAQEYVGPLTDLLGIATKAFVETIREEGVKAAIKEASPSVQKIISLMGEDMSIALDRREIGLDTLLSAASIRYAKFQADNTAMLGQANATEQMRLELLNFTRSLIDEENQLKSVRANVMGTLEKFRTANNALESYASGAQEEAGFSEMILRVNLFLDSAEAALTAVEELKAIR